MEKFKDLLIVLKWISFSKKMKFNKKQKLKQNLMIVINSLLDQLKDITKK